MTSPARLGAVADLFVYPIKSLGGVRLDRAVVGDLGLASDRRWMLVDDDGTFLTQRAWPRMALVHPTPLDGGVRVATEGAAPIEIAPPPATALREPVRIWADVVDAQRYPPSVDAWFSAAIGRPAHLVYMPADVRRPVDPAYAGPDDRAAFSDAFPVLVASRDSLADLNARLSGRGVAPVGIERFRPNVVVHGTAGAFAEDGWARVAVGEAVLRVAKPCVRCVLTTVDPATGVPSPRGEPLRTLATYRAVEGKVRFAQNALVEVGGTIATGDDVRVA